MKVGRCLAARATRAHPDWRIVSGFSEYAVGRDGSVYSYHSSRFLKPFNVKGYLRVSLHGESGRKIIFVHKLVAEAFHGRRPEGRECAHLDGDRLNNNATNLAWVTRAENEAHKRLHGTATVGGRSPHAKLTDEQAALVRIAAKRPLTRREIAGLAGVSEQIIESVIDGVTYVH